jgi:predicted HTH transcriptional regulator
MLAEELNSFLDKITKTEDTEIETTLDEVIAEGESASLEFKSSLRWNYDEGIVDKKLEQVILKSIAAFSNSEGGTLLIGVNDDGEILGLEHDFASLDGNSDEFQLHLRNLVNQNFGPAFAAANLAVSFSVIDDKEVCRVEIKKGIKPLYLTFMDKHGVKSDKFPVRSGNTSVELPLKEATAYCQGRFK